MKRICYSVAMSLDGFIADPAGGFDWIVMDPEIDFPALFARFDTMLMGRKTFEAANAMGGLGQWNMRAIVYSGTLRAEDWPGVTIMHEATAEHVRALRNEPGKDIWLFGGGELFSTFLALHAIDQVEVAVIPVLLGDGIRLLPPPAHRTRLALASHRTYAQSGIVLLTYDVITETA